MECILLCFKAGSFGDFVAPFLCFFMEAFVPLHRITLNLKVLFKNTQNELYADSLGNSSCVKVVKEERHSFDGEFENIETYELQDDELKLTNKTQKRY